MAAYRRASRDILQVCTAYLSPPPTPSLTVKSCGRAVNALLANVTPDLNAAGPCAECHELQAPWTGACASCFVEVTEKADAVALQKNTELSLSTLGARENTGCIEMLELASDPSTKLYLGGIFADAVHSAQGSDHSCRSGCPDLAQPLCKAGVCVPASCADATPFCNEASRAGWVARMLCPTTCG